MLTDTACRKALPGPIPYKLTDSGGLFLLVFTTGSKSWCWKYVQQGRERKLTLGKYPEMSLKEARLARDAARGQRAAGIDPAQAKAQRKAKAVATADSFELAARQWHRETQVPRRTPRYAAAVLARLENNVFPVIGKLATADITPAMVLALIRKVEAREAMTMAHRLRQHLSAIFVWGIAGGLCPGDPAAIITKALQPALPKQRPAVISIAAAQQVLRKVEALPLAHWSTRLASRLLALTAARPGMIRMAECKEFEGLDGSDPIWRVPPAKMKMSAREKQDAAREFVLPLSSQAVQTVKVAMVLARMMQQHHGAIWLFPGIGDPRQPISDSTLSALYRDAGLRGIHVPHGWRSTFSTVMNKRAADEERPLDVDVIELMLAHTPGNAVRAAYNRGAYMAQRRALAQLWADMLLQGLPAPETLVPALR